jgi:hypothetical protein
VLPCFAKRCRPSVAGKLFTVALRGRRMEGGNRFDKFARSQQVSAGGQDQRRDRMTTTVPALQPTATCGMAVMAKASAPGRTKTRLVPPLTFDEAAALNTAFLQDISDNIQLAGCHAGSRLIGLRAVGLRGIFSPHPAATHRLDRCLPAEPRRLPPKSLSGHFRPDYKVF